MRLDSFTISLHNFFLKVARVWIVVYSVTSKKLPNVFKSYPKMISLEKFKIFAPLQNCLIMWKILGKIIVATGIKKAPKVQ